MNLIEATKTRKRIRPANYAPNDNQGWLDPDDMENNNRIVLTRGQILGDWEVEQKKVEVTETKLTSMCEEYIENNKKSHYNEDLMVVEGFTDYLIEQLNL